MAACQEMRIGDFCKLKMGERKEDPLGQEKVYPGWEFDTAGGVLKVGENKPDIIHPDSRTHILHSSVFLHRQH